MARRSRFPTARVVRPTIQQRQPGGSVVDGVGLRWLAVPAVLTVFGLSIVLAKASSSQRLHRRR